MPAIINKIVHFCVLNNIRSISQDNKRIYLPLFKDNFIVFHETRVKSVGLFQIRTLKALSVCNHLT